MPEDLPWWWSSQEGKVEDTCESGAVDSYVWSFAMPVVLSVNSGTAVPSSEFNILLLHSSTTLSEFALFLWFSQRHVISQRKYSCYFILPSLR